MDQIDVECAPFQVERLEADFARDSNTSQVDHAMPVRNQTFLIIS